MAMLYLIHTALMMEMTPSEVQKEKSPWLPGMELWLKQQLTVSDIRSFSDRYQDGFCCKFRHDVMLALTKMMFGKIIAMHAVVEGQSSKFFNAHVIATYFENRVRNAMWNARECMKEG